VVELRMAGYHGRSRNDRVGLGPAGTGSGQPTWISLSERAVRASAVPGCAAGAHGWCALR